MTEYASPSDMFARRVEIGDASGNISPMLGEATLSQLASDVIREFEEDMALRKSWEDKARAALKRAAQEDGGAKDWPWPGAANAKFPILTVAALQFNARAYPAIVKGDEAVSVKPIGRDKGRPQLQMTPQGLVPMQDPMTGEPVWAVPPGAKRERAARVKDYLNTVLFYRMEGWEEDTDQLLTVLPIVGCAFRKVTYQNGKLKAQMVSALKVVVPVWATCCATTPRLTEIIDNLATYQVEARMMSGEYRPIALVANAEGGYDPQKPRVLLEQHRFCDLVGDGTAQPYIVTVDKETSQVLRVEPNFDRTLAMTPGEIKKRSVYYVKYGFFPNPSGEFYDIGFGHLLTQIEDIINTLINQMLDAGTAQIAGGGFIASGLRLQGKGPSVMRWRPGEYKTVDTSGGDLRTGIVDRTFPNVSPVTFQLLDMMLAAAKDITSVKDVITGDASNNGQVGTTLALIEQSLAQFSAVYKRVYRSLKTEFQMVFDYLSQWGGQAAAEDYAVILDDEMADFEADFDGRDMDIRPVSDPASVTKMQKLSQAQFLLSLRGMGLDDMEIMRRVLEAADVEDAEKLFPQGVDPMQEMAAKSAEADIEATQAKAARDMADAHMTGVEAMIKGFDIGALHDIGGIRDLEGESGDPMGDGGLQNSGADMQDALA